MNDLIKQKARDLGFDLVGIAPAAPSQYRDYLRHWLDDGQAGTMDYLAARFNERTDPSVYLPGAASVICVAMNYYAALEAPEEPLSHDRGRVARYALGNDYHEIIKPRLFQLADFVRTLDPSAQTRCSVDTGPVMEKELAARAGLGWIGKNTCVINESIGSWLFLGEVLTTLPLTPDQPAVDRCGTCRRCIDACPTAAITAPYQLDARKCISYLTIESREPISAELEDKLSDYLYGCDICQDVCPWNRRAPETNSPEFAPRFPAGSIDLNDVLQWTQETYRATLRGSAMKRVKLPVLQQTARILLSAK